MNYKNFFILLFFISLVLIPSVHAEEFNIYSNNAILYNVSEDKIMYEKNSNEKAAIASLTKIMTALIVIENVNDFNQKINFDKVNYSYLLKNDLALSSLNSDNSYTYEDMLYDFIMESSADCGYALALSIADNEEVFVKLMNDKAKELGMKNTKFANPVGLDDPNNYSTMNDMLILMKAVLKNNKLKNIISTFHYVTDDGIKINHTMYYYIKHFKLHMPYFKGGKTGHEIKPGYALASFATQDGCSYILVTTNASDKYEIPTHFIDAKKIYDYYFSNYGYQNIYNTGDILKEYKTTGLKEKTIKIRTKKDITSYLKNDYNKKEITTKYIGKDNINIFTKKGEKLGILNIYYQNKLINSTPIMLDQNIHFSFHNFVKDNKYTILTILISIIFILCGFLIILMIKVKINKN